MMLRKSPVMRGPNRTLTKCVSLNTLVASLIRDVSREIRLPGFEERSHVWGLPLNVLVDRYSAALREYYPRSSRRAFALNRLVTRFSAKYCDPDPQLKGERDAATYEKLRATEIQLRETNRKLRRREPWWGPTARSFILQCIGPSPQFEGSDSVFDASRHGPGAALGCRGGSREQKFANWPIPCSRAAQRHLIRLLRCDERWYVRYVDNVRDVFGIRPWSILDREVLDQLMVVSYQNNRITTVPKSSEINRSIAIEPIGNILLQLGVDGVIRRGLRRRYGVNLNSQTWNQKLALRGSLTRDGFATVDLSSASDSVGMRLCKLLLPSDWYHYLADLRSPSGSVDGQLMRYRKISSMGNGYTFALESMIFAALVNSAAADCGYEWGQFECGIYGDDIIVPIEIYHRLIPILADAGFTVNSAKTFCEGYFRESCGVDAFRGAIVTPVYLRRPLENCCDVFSLHNQLIGWSAEVFGRNIFELTCATLAGSVAPSFRCCGPALSSHVDNWLWVISNPIRDIHGCIQVRGVSRQYKKHAPQTPFGAMLHDLRNCESDSSRFLTNRDNCGTFRVAVTTATEWPCDYPCRPVGELHRLTPMSLIGSDEESS